MRLGGLSAVVIRAGARRLRAAHLAVTAETLWCGSLWNLQRREMVEVSRFVFLAALYCLSSQAMAQELSPEGRAAFRAAVEDYQMFVVPHCAPGDVRAYLRA